MSKKDATKATGPIRVRALREGFAFGHRVRKGMVFTIPDMTHFTDRWMAIVPPDTTDDVVARLHAKPAPTPQPRWSGGGPMITPAPQGSIVDEPTGNQDVLNG